MSQTHSKTEERPLVTFALFAYNQERFIKEAVEGALAQTYSPLEIYISDDCSSDNTFEIIKDLTKDYKGPHTLIINRNKQNLGIADHVNHIFSVTTGELVVMAAGDDISLPHRTEKMVEEWLKTDKPSGIGCRYQVIDDHGNRINPKNWAYEEPDPRILQVSRERQLYAFADRKNPILLGAAACWSREIYVEFEPLGLKNFEDVVFSLRSCLHKGLHFSKDILLLYRMHDTNISPHKIDVHRTVNEVKNWMRGVSSHRRNCIDSSLISIVDVATRSIDPEIKKKYIKRLSREVSVYTLAAEWWQKSWKFRLQTFCYRDRKALPDYPYCLLPLPLYLRLKVLRSSLRQIIWGNSRKSL